MRAWPDGQDGSTSLLPFSPQVGGTLGFAFRCTWSSTQGAVPPAALPAGCQRLHGAHRVLRDRNALAILDQLDAENLQPRVVGCCLRYFVGAFVADGIGTMRGNEFRRALASDGVSPLARCSRQKSA